MNRAFYPGGKFEAAIVCLDKYFIYQARGAAYLYLPTDKTGRRKVGLVPGQENARE